MKAFLTGLYPGLCDDGPERWEYSSTTGCYVRRTLDPHADEDRLEAAFRAWDPEDGLPEITEHDPENFTSDTLWTVPLRSPAAM